MSVGYNLSFSDLLLVDKFTKAYGDNDQDVIKQVLFENGLDVSMGVEEVLCTHRNLQGNVVTCILYQGHERNCKEWLVGGSASWDAIVENCSLDLRIDLKTIGAQINNTGMIIDQLQKHAN